MSRFNQQGMYYSNCFLEMVKAKIRYGNNVKCIYVSPKLNDVNCPHYMWHDIETDSIMDFHCDNYVEKWWHLVWWKGYIRCRPYSWYEDWLKIRREQQNE